MYNYQANYVTARRMGQAPAPVTPPAPAPAMQPPPAPPPAPALGGFLDTLKWAAIGFGAGALTGYTLAKTGTIGGDKTGMNSGLLGGLSGVAASVLPGLLGLK